MDGRGWRAALPNSLPEAVLLRLAHDFRRVEQCFGAARDTAEDEPSESVTSAVYVVMSLAAQHPARVGQTSELEFTEAGMMRAIQLYQWGLEREIAARILGVPSPNEARSLLEGFWQAMHD